MANEQTRSINRRTITAGIAWAAPAVATAVAAPAYAVSPSPSNCTPKIEAYADLT